MAITFSQEKRKNNFKVLILVIVLLTTFFVIWKIFFADKNTSHPENFSEALSPQKIEIDIEALNNPVLKDMQSFAGSPDFDGKVGRENPFTPY